MEHTDRSGTRGEEISADMRSFRDATGATQVVTFRMGGELFALPVEPVGQILPMLAITPLPEGAGGVVDSVLGAINLHGQVVPVVDLRRHVGFQHATMERDTPIVVARVGELTVGLVVDEVVDVVAVRAAHVTPPGMVLPAELGNEPVLAGLLCLPGAAAGQLALLLDAACLFAPQQRQALVRAVELLHEQAANTRGAHTQGADMRGAGAQAGT